jgi:hypothetical protein
MSASAIAYTIQRKPELLGQTPPPLRGGPCSFLPSPLVGLAPPTLLGYWSRHRHGMNYTNDPFGTPP